MDLSGVLVMVDILVAELIAQVNSYVDLEHSGYEFLRLSIEQN
jgi:hypothetical protein